MACVVLVHFLNGANMGLDFLTSMFHLKQLEGQEFNHRPGKSRAGRRVEQRLTVGVTGSQVRAPLPSQELLEYTFQVLLRMYIGTRGDVQLVHARTSSVPG